jgi:hypothetical protein
VDLYRTVRVEAVETGGDNPEFRPMSNIPLDLERRFEHRWAARFLRPVEPTAFQKQRLKGGIKSSPRPAKGKRKTPRLGPAGR